jgi:hypothetical protein
MVPQVARAKGGGAHQLAVGAVQDEEVAVLVEVPQEPPAALLEEDVLVDAVVVPHVVRRPLVVPAERAVVRIDGDHGARVQVAPGARAAVEHGPGLPVPQYTRSSSGS